MSKIMLGQNLFKNAEWVEPLRQLGKRFAIVTDTHVEKLFGLSLKKRLEDEGLEAHLFCCPPGEKSKTRECKALLEDQMIEKNLGRDTVLMALGGGVITDLGGYIAATFCRGIPYVSIPTSLLAMVDASIGGKVGVNTPYAKNQIGLFYHPKILWVDVAFLKELPQKEWVNGCAEMIKYGLIASPSLFQKLENGVPRWQTKEPDFILELIQESIGIKQEIVAKDPEEKLGLRRILNCGHTLGHAWETASSYHLSHGEAIAMGMIAESFLSQKLGFLSKEENARIETLFQRYGFSLRLPQNLLEKTVKESLQKDKKALLSQPRFVLLEKIGKTLSFGGAYCSTVEPKILEETLAWSLAKFKEKR